MKIGATYLGNSNCQFTVWAPLLEKVALQIVDPEPRLIAMQQDVRGYWQTTASNINPGTLYRYQLEGEVERPDPASNFQPLGVHAPSQVLDHSSFSWDDFNWASISLEEMITYELHVGTFTTEGTFAAIIPRLSQLQELGINAIELMPVAQFPGDRNWGYDGVYPFAVQNSYGGSEGLKELVNACHQKGIAVILDVVYNHFGPEGNYTSNFAPYFNPNYQTPWGSAINFDNAYSYGVRNFFIENALYWFREYHIDALRLDAVHAIYDFGAKHFLAELVEAVTNFSQEQGRKFYLIAESDLNDIRLIQPKELGGYGLDGQWNDDFHHVLHTFLTGEKEGYYQDFCQGQQLKKAITEGFVYSWQYSPFRKRHHGSYSGNLPASQFVVFSQNHDQIGNRMLGERLSQLVSFEALKLAAGVILFSPALPMLFMGQEYGEEAPFLYFVSHSDPDLIEAVKQGRKSEFQDFSWQGEPPNPQSPETFLQSKLNWQQRDQGKHQVLLKFYQFLIQLRCQLPALKKLNRQNLEVLHGENEQLILLRRWHDTNQVLLIMNFSQQALSWQVTLDNNWQKRLDSSESQWLGSGSGLPETLTLGENLAIQSQSLALYIKE
ncbi:MAG: malto-oligosyltrehalose trehalohydrolase [Coleofasciculaceae cyanobacterium]